MIPPLSDLLDSARVVALPMHSRFRGVDVREALLFEGPEFTTATIGITFLGVSTMG